jgi:hypothetical protein
MGRFVLAVRRELADERLSGPLTNSPGNLAPTSPSEKTRALALQGFRLQGRQDSNLQPPVWEV